ncbi:MAG: ABC transporter ATP-binding protein [Clostridia bacterium]|nr:ABC transporter ATP-binding protein [Clostridia bacterium]
MKDKLKRTIMRDIAGAIALPTTLYLIGDLAEYLAAVYTANVTAGFADAVLEMDVSLGLAQALKMLAAAAMTVLISPLFGLWAENTDLKYALRLDRRIFSRFLSKRCESAMKIDVGEAAQRLEDDTIELRCAVRAVSENIILVPVILVYLLISSLSISLPMTLAVFAISLIKLAVPSLTAKMKARFAEAGRDYASAARGIETQIARQPGTLRLLGIGGLLTGRLDGMFKEHFDKVIRKSAAYETAADGIQGSLDTLCTVLLLLCGAVMAAAGMISPGSVAAMIGYFGVFGTMFEKIGEIIKQAPNISALAERMKLLYDGAERTGGKKISGFTVMKARDLGYSYGDTAALRPVSFSLKNGERIAVTGPNGSGKSTLIKVISGLLDGYDGELTADGISLKEIDPASWRRLISYAPQDPFLFSGSVRDNIRLGSQSAGDDETDAVIESLGLAELAEKKVGEDGEGLSGGERQRISIARAVMKNAPLLLLDEPSNNLDTDGLEKIISIIRGYHGAVMFISHIPELTAAKDAELRLSAEE